MEEEGQEAIPDGSDSYAINQSKRKWGVIEGTPAWNVKFQELIGQDNMALSAPRIVLESC